MRPLQEEYRELTNTRTHTHTRKTHARAHTQAYTSRKKRGHWEEEYKIDKNTVSGNTLQYRRTVKTDSYDIT